MRCTIVDEQASKEQRDALTALDTGQHGGLYWEIFEALCPNLIEALFAPITLSFDAFAAGLAGEIFHALGSLYL